SFAAMRQNDGSLLNASPSPRAGGVNAPAATVWTAVMVAFDRVRDERHSHRVEAASACNDIAQASVAAHEMLIGHFIAIPPTGAHGWRAQAGRMAKLRRACNFPDTVRAV